MRVRPAAQRFAAAVLATVVALVSLGASHPEAATVPWQVVHSPNPSPGRTTLNGVACVTSSNCWAVGYSASLNDSALILHWNGSSWTKASSPSFLSSAVLQAVTCLSATSCWAVGAVDTHTHPLMLVEHWDGAVWAASVLAAPSDGTDPYLWGVTCTRDSDCWSVGDFTPTGQLYRQPLTEHWNGSSWTKVSTPAPTSQDFLYGVSCVSSNYCLAAGMSDNRPLAELWDGTSWTVTTTATVPQGLSLFKAVTCVSTAECWGVGSIYGSGSGTLIEQWNGAAWTVANSPSSGGVPELEAVGCVAASDCWAAGRGATTGAIADHWDGTSWSSSSLPGLPGALFAVACVSTSLCWSVGAVQSSATGYIFSLTERWNGTAWSRVNSTSSGTQPAVLHATACTDASHCWAVGWHYTPNVYWGNRSYAMQWNGSRWIANTTQDDAGTPYDYLEGVACVTASNCWAVGHNDVNNSGGPNDQTLVENWNGSSWHLVQSPNASNSGSDDLNAVTCTSASMCWGVGSVSFSQSQQPLMEQWNGAAWSIASPSAPGTTSNGVLSAVTCVSDVDCWAVGNIFYGTLTEHWNGSAWTVVSSPSTGNQTSGFLEGVKCVATNDCWAAGYVYDSSKNLNSALTEHWNGTSWAIVPSALTTDDVHLSGVDCPGGGECWAVGWSYDPSNLTTHTLTEHWNGSQWTIGASADMPGAGTIEYSGSMLESVVCVSLSDCRAVGSATGDDNTPLTLVENNTAANS